MSIWLLLCLVIYFLACAHAQIKTYDDISIRPLVVRQEIYYIFSARPILTIVTLTPTRMPPNSRNTLPEPYSSWQDMPPESPEDALVGMEMIRQGLYEGIITTATQLHLALQTLTPFLSSFGHDPSYEHVPDVDMRIEMSDRLPELYQTLHARNQLTQPLPINEETVSILWQINRIRGRAKKFCMQGEIEDVQHAIKKLPYELSLGVPVTSTHFSFPPEEITRLQQRGGIVEGKKMLKALENREKRGLPTHTQRKQLDGFLRNRGLTEADLVKAPIAQESASSSPTT